MCSVPLAYHYQDTSTSVAAAKAYFAASTHLEMADRPEMLTLFCLKHVVETAWLTLASRILKKCSACCQRQ